MFFVSFPPILGHIKIEFSTLNLYNCICMGVCYVIFRFYKMWKLKYSGVLLLVLENFKTQPILTTTSIWFFRVLYFYLFFLFIHTCIHVYVVHFYIRTFFQQLFPQFFHFKSSTFSLCRRASTATQSAALTLLAWSQRVQYSV